MSTRMKFELLPNEVFIECFQYLNAPDIFHSFDRLNYRFHILIRNIPLHLNFQQFKIFQFNEFSETMLSNPEIRQNIIYLKLQNVDKCDGQIQSFLSLFPLNDFIHLRSLSLINTNTDNVEQLLPMLPFLSDLYSFSCTTTSSSNTPLKITSTILKSQIRMLTVPQFDFNSEFSYETASLTALTIRTCDIFDLCQLLKYTSMLKYLNIRCFNYGKITDNHLDFTNVNVVHLKQLIINYSSAKFQYLELLLKCIPNLKIFSLSAHLDIKIADADRWQYLIETSLLHLNVFKFHFTYSTFCHPSNEVLMKLQKFQTDFWRKQHHCYTTYETEKYSASVYTVPYMNNTYRLKSTIKRYTNSLASNSNEFDNVDDLDLSPELIRDDSTYYFRNIQSLTLINDIGHDDDDTESEEYDLSTTQIELLNMIVNVSSIKHLGIDDDCYISSSLLLNLLKKLPKVSSLTIQKRSLIRFLQNRDLCKYLNAKITTLDISIYYRNRYMKSNQIDLLCEAIPNLEQLYCYIKNVDDLLKILGKCSKLSMINLKKISEEIYSWIEINTSTFNVYIDFTGID